MTPLWHSSACLALAAPPPAGGGPWGRTTLGRPSRVWCTALPCSGVGVPCSGVGVQPKPSPLETRWNTGQEQQQRQYLSGLIYLGSCLPGPTTQMPAAPMVFVLPGPILQFFLKPQEQPCIFTINSFSIQANQFLFLLLNDPNYILP